MYTANDVYGPLPVAATPLTAATPAALSGSSTAPGMVGRPGMGEPVGGGDPILMWVILLGLAIGLGWLSVSVRIG